MLRDLRNYFPKWLMATFLGLIVLFMVVGSFYNPSRYGSAAAKEVVATVNKKKIRRLDWYHAVLQIKRLQQVDPLQFVPEKEPIWRAQALEELITEEILEQSFYKKGYRAHPKAVIEYLQNNAVLKKTFPKEILSKKGPARRALLNQTAKYKITSQCFEALRQSTFVLAKETRNLVRLIYQKRDFHYLELKAEAFLPSKDELSLAELNAYYSQQLSQFRVPEQVSIEYILLDGSDISETLKQQYPDDPTLVEKKLMAHIEQQMTQLNACIKQPNHSLAEVAKVLNLPIQSTELFTRKGGSTAMTKNPKVIATVFSKSALKERKSVLIQLDSGTMIVVRVKDYQPLRLAAFEEVVDRVREQLSRKKAKEAVKQYGDELAASLKQHPDSVSRLTKAGQWKKVDKAERDSKHIASWLLNAAFTVSPTEKVQAISMPNGDCVVIQLSRIKYGSLSQLTDKQHELIKNSLSAIMAQLDKRAYFETSKRQSVISYSLSS